MFQVNPCNVHLRSIPSDEDNITHSMKTQMVLSPNEFTDFQVRFLIRYVFIFY